jgi:hypothetical protein
VCRGSPGDDKFVGVTVPVWQKGKTHIIIIIIIIIITTKTKKTAAAAMTTIMNYSLQCSRF